MTSNEQDEMMKFSANVCALVENGDGISMIDAIIEYCNQKSIELELVPSLISPKVIAQLHSDAVSLNWLKKEGTLFV